MFESTPRIPEWLVMYMVFTLIVGAAAQLVGFCIGIFWLINHVRFV